MEPAGPESSKPLRIVLIVALLLVVTGAACCGGLYLVGDRVRDSILPEHTGSGVLAEQRRLVEGFDRVRLEAPLDVDIRIGETFVVTLRADHNLHPFIETVVQDGTLVIRARERFASDAGVTVEVTLPALRAVVNAGVGDISIEGLDEAALDVIVTGVGDVRGAGRVGDLTVQVSGVGDALLADVVAERVTAQTSGVGDVEVQATVALDIVISGVGDVRYRGDPPELRQTKSGVGDVVRIR